MNEILREKLKEVPENPGIYKMLDKNGKIIYIGKSKCLKKRVHSYFVPTPKWDKARKMFPSICDIEWEVTDTHLEAMLLECRLIKEIKPYFNTMMKNDERYFYLNVSDSARKSPLFVTYERQEYSYGPFRSRGMIEEFVQTMKNFYPLNIKDGKYELEYHIFPVSMRNVIYQDNAERLRELFDMPEKIELFYDAIESQMAEVAAMQKFEMAIRYREFLENIRYVQQYLNETRNWMKEDVVYRVKTGDGYKLFYIRKGMVIYKALYKRVTAASERAFIRTARKIESTENISEKSRLDYVDIVCAELMQAGSDAVKIVR